MPNRLLRSVPARALAAFLCVAVSVIHLEDQHWLAFDKDPRYVLVGYLMLEVCAVIAAVWLLARPSRPAWVLAAATAAGPLLGFVLSRATGLPDYRDDLGNWAELLGVVSLIVESALLVLSATVLVGKARTRPASVNGEGVAALSRSERRRATSDR